MLSKDFHNNLSVLRIIQRFVVSQAGVELFELLFSIANSRFAVARILGSIIPQDYLVAVEINISASLSAFTSS